MSSTLTFSKLVGDFSSSREESSLPHPYVVFKVGGKKTQTKVRRGYVLVASGCTIALGIDITSFEYRRLDLANVV